MRHVRPPRRDLPPLTARAGRAQRGAALVEFALVAFAFYLLIAATVTFGQLLHSAQVAQDAARAGARELALTPIRANWTFEQALSDPTVRDRVFDPDLLVIDLDNIPGGVDLDTYFAGLPVINRSLRPVMIYDLVDVGGSLRTLLRYPGALVTAPTAPSGLSVAIPRVVTRDADGHETIEWLPVVEEVRTDRNDPTTGPFSVQSGALDSGLVALRINIPYQSAAMSSFRQSPAGMFEPNGNFVNEADDAAVVELNAAPGALAAGASAASQVYAGPYGLGVQQALGKEVRPFRRVLTAQALFRREVFFEQSQP